MRIILWVLVAVAAVAAGALYWREAGSRQPQPMQVSFGGPFTLIDGKGQPFPSSRLAGRPYAVFFGFTNCPDVCPTTLARLVKLRRQLGDEDAFQIVFITVDPERDGPAEVGRYAGLFESPVIGLTGSPAQIARVKKDYGIYSEKAGTGDNYSVDHTATVLLFDKTGRFQSTISHDEADSAALAKLRRMTAG
ncbi:MAG TPA: SCO family protein [Sphingomicrobium sp.]|nr:SCO family protein [Sphingomicrobium sp.]